jgi:hypothetical protein
MKETIAAIKSHREDIEAGGKGKSTEEMVALLELLMDLAELHPRSNLNLCLFGGFPELMAVIFGHPHHLVRAAACQVATTICMNN